MLSGPSASTSWVTAWTFPYCPLPTHSQGRDCEMGLPVSSQLTRAAHTGHQGALVKDEDQIPEWCWRG